MSSTYSMHAVQDAADAFIEESEKSFTLDEFAEYIKENVKIPPAKVAEAEECAMAVLQDVHSGVLYSPLSKMFCRRDVFFNGKKYLVCPYENELKSGVLVAGFRFAIFDGENQTDAASISLCEHGKKKKFLLRSYKSTLQDLARYFIFSGPDEMFSTLMAESDENAAKIADRHGDFLMQQMELEVFDFTQFYKTVSFKLGDYLEITVMDAAESEFSVRHVPAGLIDADKKRKWLSLFERSLESVFDEYGAYLDAPNQIAFALYTEPSVMENPAASLEDYASEMENMQIDLSNGWPVLVPVRAGGEESDDSKPGDDIMMSRGKTSSIEEILIESGCPMNTVEIETFIYNDLYNGNEHFQSFYDNCFGGLNLEFADEAQEAIFMNFAEDLWECASERYNRFRDELKGPFREKLIAMIDARVRWMREFVGSLSDEQLSSDLFSSLDKVIADTVRVCGLINSDYMPDSDGIAHLSGEIDKIVKRQRKAINALSAKYGQRRPYSDESED